LQLDDTDQRIIAALTADARASFADIGQRVALSAPAVKRRVDRLRSTGVIKGFTAIVDPAALGWTTEAFVELFCTGRTTPAMIGAAVRRHPEVVGAYTVSGEADAVVHLRAADIPQLERALERLRSESFVTSTRSMIVLSRLVDSHLG
jgi:DNA-binding Lrp family transcriptional regulator